MNPEVLILSGLYDFSTDLVSLRLNEAGVPFLRLNREHFTDLRLSLEPIAPGLAVKIAGNAYEVGPGLKAIWFRQPVFLRNTPAQALTPAEQLERSQWMAFLRSLCVFEKAAWMNYPRDTYLAESKPYQLHAAAQCGFTVPETIVSNDAARIRAEFPGEAIVKSLDTVLMQDGDDCLFTYTTISRAASLNDETVGSAPLLAQQLLEAKIDLRVTIVGDRLFAVRILSNGKGVAGDWRTLPRSAIQYVDAELSPTVQENCFALAKRLRLRFAAIDLIETPNDTFFIEVNPTGEWGWLSTGERRIADEIAQWLTNPPTQEGSARQ